jgi:hypothetical protein
MIPSAILLRARKSRLGLPAYPFVSMHFIDFLIGMTTVNSAVLEIAGIVDRSRSHGSRQNKAVIGINAGMLFEAIMRDIFLNNPVRDQITMEFKRILSRYKLRPCITCTYYY